MGGELKRRLAALEKQEGDGESSEPVGRVIIYKRGQCPPVTEGDGVVIFLPDNGRGDREASNERD